MFKDLIRRNRGYYLLVWLLAVVAGLSVVANVCILQGLIDAVVQNDTDKTQIYTIAIGSCFLVQWISVYGGKRVSQMLSNRIKEQEGERILQQISEIPYESYENKEHLPVIDQVLKNHVTQMQSISTLTTTIASFACTLVGLLVYVSTVKWWYLLLVFFTTIPMWVLTIIGASREGSFANKAWKYMQRTERLSNVLNSRNYVKEAKIFDFFALVSQRWEDNFAIFRKGKIKSSLGPRFITGLIAFLQFALTVLLLSFLIKDFSTNKITLGMLVSSMNALWQILGQGLFTIVGIITGVVGYSTYRQQEKKLEQLRKTEVKGDIELEAIEIVEVKNVSFHYPNEEKEVLSGVNLTIRKGEKVALVGENGSGKSTLSKIIVGLLQPTEGEIWINGRNAKEYTPESRKRAFACVFQDYGTFNLSIRDNLLLAEEEKETDEIVSLIHKFDAALLEDIGENLDLRLGKLTEGSRELSGGQWQKIAILRAMLQTSSMFLLDEPTASIDPVLERDIFGKILSLTEDKTSLIVTHRMGTVKQMNSVFVLKDGRIEESGSHEELMKRGGYYEQLYKAQEQWYR